ncbi:hypothetical protein AVEN_176672-1 [Araneus ventricosus]|uniref:Uncharacterized protein n=1 Tax=Araneus ventricosus TaxID=182803 RepID=A0A4Y2ETJ8_ARAVE|nr:hypothetical protein AVEN_176672-1 [Araneus ventricosus]
MADFSGEVDGGGDATGKLVDAVNNVFYGVHFGITRDAVVDDFTKRGQFCDADLFGGGDKIGADVNFEEDWVAITGEVIEQGSIASPAEMFFIMPKSWVLQEGWL